MMKITEERRQQAMPLLRARRRVKHRLDLYDLYDREVAIRSARISQLIDELCGCENVDDIDRELTELCERKE